MRINMRIDMRNMRIFKKFFYLRKKENMRTFGDFPYVFRLEASFIAALPLYLLLLLNSDYFSIVAESKILLRFIGLVIDTLKSLVL
jgi:hypothetical protein